jgi:hypothetical protein
MRALPILMLFAAMFYWLWRVRRRSYTGPGMQPCTPGTTRELTAESGSRS